ncbi:C69 family dipeptidase [Ligilactobacillus equi]|uniref:C69 family dipeptidase n=1 Tax=Ligilactobacillus equi TaxID=137357 RepID=UPI002ED467B7
MNKKLKPAECTTILVGKKASLDGSTMIARSEDGGSEIIPESFVVVNPEQQPESYQAVISGQKIDSVDLLANPLRYSSVPDTSGKHGTWAAAGINDATVAMTATETITTNARIQALDPLLEEGGLGEEDFVTLTLPYISSAREGVKRLGYLLEKYGTYEMNGSAFADQDEVWYIESIGGHHWAARRIPDDAYVVAPNRLNIDEFHFDDPDNYMCSADLLNLIEKYHLNPDTDGYNLRHIFGSATVKDAHYNNPRAWFVHKYFDDEWQGNPGDQEQPFITYAKKKISVEDIKFLEGSHYQETEFDPYSTTNTAAQKKLFRPIGINRNFETHILQIRNDVADGLAGVQWLGYGTNTYNVFVPFYTNVTTTPASFMTSPSLDLSQIFWLNKVVAQIADTNPRLYGALHQAYEEKTTAALRRIEWQTDAEVADLVGQDLQAKLAQANQAMADLTMTKTQALLEEMLKAGHTKMTLKYDLLD